MIVIPSGKTEFYTHFPDVAAGYEAAITDEKVIDCNTVNSKRLDFQEPISISFRSPQASHARAIKEKYPNAESITCAVDELCCFKYSTFENNRYVGGRFGDNMPFPKYENFDTFSLLAKSWQNGERYYPILTEVGCPARCVYCAARNRGWAARSAQNCFDELWRAKRKWGINYFMVMDDAFNMDIERVIDFCDLIIPLNLKWKAANGLRADRCSQQMFKAMKMSGCNEVSFGVESIDNEVLKTIQKGESFEQIDRAVEWAKAADLMVNAYFIIGLPGSTYETDLRAVEWVKQKKIRATFSYLLPQSDKPDDAQFFGNLAEPTSDAYPKEQQKKIYQMTEGFRQKKANKFLKDLAIKTGLYNFLR
jgi:tRNA A37 methylthiotransferase MiaB